MKNRRSKAGAKSGDTEREQAATLAIEALSFLAAEPERLGQFLALSGIGPEAIREAAGDPNFLAAVIGHVASDERLLLDFAAHAQIKPTAVMRALAALGGVWERDTP